MTNGFTSHRHGGRSLLVIAHPGHELRLFNWLSEAKPDVLVLTDGSGGLGWPRIDATQHVLDAAGARAGPLFGAYSDRRIYQAMLSESVLPFIAMTRFLIAHLRAGHYRMVVADPFEGYNPTHDLCRLLVNVAVLSVQQCYGQEIRNFDYPLTELSNFTASHSVTVHRLSHSAQQRKRVAAAAYVELAHEIDSVRQREGDRAFREEVLHEIDCDASSIVPHLPRPYYETYGERQRASGRYATVIRHSEHFVPIVKALSSLIERPPALSSQCLIRAALSVPCATNAPRAANALGAASTPRAANAPGAASAQGAFESDR